MRFNKWIIILALFVIAGIGAWIWWKSPSSGTIKKEAAEHLTPTVNVASLNITDIDDQRVKLESKLIINNPLPVDINTKKLQYEIFIDSIKVIEDSYAKPIRIRSSDSSTIELPLELLAKPMERILKYFNENKIDSADYSIKASFEVDVPIAGERKFTMNMTKRLPAFRIPKIKVKDLDLHALSLKSKGVDMVVKVTNLNKFPLKMSDGKFSFTMEDAMQMKGVLEKTINIPAGGSQDVSMHAEITDGNMLKSGWKLMTDKKDTHFKYHFSCNIKSDNKMLSNSKMVMNMTGTMDELLNVAKNK